MEEYLELKIPSDPKMMRLVRRNVSLACEMVGFDQREVNAITLAYRDKIVILLKDFGGKVDLEEIEKCRKKRQRELEKHGPVRPGGLGVLLIHSVMDKVQYKTSLKSGTVLRLTKYLSPPKEAKVAGSG